MLIRRERPDDQPAVRAMIEEAFGDPAAGKVPIEVSLVDALRKTSEWMPRLSLVAEAEEGQLVGYVVCTRGWVERRPALALGPLAVARDRQRRGTGSALMHAVLGAADALDEPLVALVGHAEYYPRFGFRPAADLRIRPPVPAWAVNFQIRTLSTYQPDMCGGFRLAEPFTDL